MNRKGSILVVDDEEIMREILDALLSQEGYDVRLAADAQQALDLARTMSFDAAIVDMMMPGMDGISTLDELKTAASAIGRIVGRLAPAGAALAAAVARLGKFRAA